MTAAIRDRGNVIPEIEEKPLVPNPEPIIA